MLEYGKSFDVVAFGRFVVVCHVHPCSLLDGTSTECWH